jgi:RNA polymerase sigma-70 factor (ECF subfamily)
VDATEHTWLALAALGDRAAFAQLVRLHQGAVRIYLRRLTQNADLADDMAQETFMVAMTRLSSFRGEGAFVGWLKRIAASQFLMHLRKGCGQKRLIEAFTSDLQAHGADSVAHSAYAGEGVTLDRALTMLSEPERVCVVMSHGGEFSHGDIAEITGLPLGTVKSHVNRGTTKLKAALGVPTQKEPGHVVA